MSPVIARFTPGIMPPEVLETFFVSRQPILDALVQRAEEAATGVNQHHTLIVGPRGSGKTHLLTMAYNRVQGLADQGARLRVVRLPEDPWTIVSYGHFLQAITSALGSDTTNEQDCEAWLVTSAMDLGTVVVFAENLDRILTQIGVQGQARLRRLLQTSDALLMLASTTTLDRNLATSSKPFYCFFTTIRLNPLSIEEARQMLKSIARVREDTDLEIYLDTPQATARLATIALIAGSQPRVWASLANMMSVDSFTSLTDLLIHAFDDLVPCYQEQMAGLAPQQRLVVAELARANHPLHVAALAERLGMDPKSAARTVIQLKNMHWLSEVRPGFGRPVDKRRTYYELAEPMTRFILQVKDGCEQKIASMVDFLILWFSGKDDPRACEASYDNCCDMINHLTDALACLIHPANNDVCMSLPTVLRTAVEESPNVEMLQQTTAAFLDCVGRHDEAEILRLGAIERGATSA